MDTVEGTRAVTLYTTRPHGNLTLDIGERKHAVLPRISLANVVRWASDAPTELEFTGRCTLAGYPEGAFTVAMESEQSATAVFKVSRVLTGVPGGFGVPGQRAAAPFGRFALQVARTDLVRAVTRSIRG
ncbi:hypothetical protein F8R89_22425 [Streptomyces sp. SS1-1]|uniref:hypothetical protein n=1 Tax=Streptomyces sp. SS1-1 TaxID=2651869 RepID=UPI001250C6F3|nr:hypothetical protein [Streptomyces sp. SS1-1]KAB2974496.1 hypothetical protein F8R89_22425 [Streptomyces sp. SS1-1]